MSLKGRGDLTEKIRRRKKRVRRERRQRRKSLRQALGGDVSAYFSSESWDKKRQRLDVGAELSAQLLRSMKNVIKSKTKDDEGEMKLVVKISVSPSPDCKVYLVKNQDKPKFGKMSCPACGGSGQLTKHHNFPVSLFGANPNHLWLCRKCHDLLERMILEEEKRIAGRRRRSLLPNGRFKLRESDYFFIAGRFLKRCGK